jgi:fucose permease
VNDRNDYSTTFRRFATAATFAGLFAFALTVTITPAAVNQISVELCHRSKALVGYLYEIAMAGFLVCVLLGGRYSDRRGKLPVLATGGVLMAIGSYVFAHASGYATAMVAVCVMGAGGGLCEGISMAAIADLYETRRRTPMMNLAQVFFAVGAVVGPSGVSWLLAKHLDWRWAYVATSCFCVLAAALAVAAVTKHEERPVAHHHSGDWRALLKDRLVLALALGILLYVAAEAGQGCWLAAYFKHNLHSAGPIAAATVALFWAGIGLGRAVTTWTAHHLSDYVIVCIALGLATVCQTALLLVHSPIPGLVLVPALGIALAPVWPTTISRASALHPMQTGAVLSIVVAAGGLGGGLIPAAIGQAADKIGLRPALWSCAVLSLINFALFVVIWARHRTRPQAP